MHQPQFFYSIKRKRQNILWLRLQSATWRFCPPHRFPGQFETPDQPRLCLLMTEQVKTGWDRELPRPVFSFFSARTLRYRAQGMDRASLICARLIWLGFHRDAVDKTRRLACSVCVPHGALRASYCHSTRPFGTRGALQGGVPSLCRPVIDYCAVHRPTTSLPPYLYFTATQTVTDCGNCMPNV